MPELEIRNVDKFYGETHAVKSVSLAVEAGQFIVLVGPSGCGKSTLLRSIAGLEEISAGDILLGGRSIANLQPRDRNIAMVFQSYALYPYLTVFENIAFGLRARKTPEAEIDKSVRWASDLLHIGDFLGRYPRELSGGQRQRVAIGRAIVRDADLFLFDEPLSNLDAKLREQMRVEIVRLQREVGITSVFVTHDQTEALVMSDRIVVMDKAEIQQVGDPQTIYASPVNAFVANFIGVTSLLEGRLLDRAEGFCEIEVPVGGGAVPLRLRASGGEGAARGDRIVLSLRPEDVSLHLEEPEGAANLFEGEVIDTIYLGNFLEGRVRVGDREIGIRHHEYLAPGRKVHLSFRPEHGLCLTE